MSSALNMTKFARCQSQTCLEMHIFQNGTPWQSETCFRMAHISEWHATRTSLRGVKACKIGKNSCVFGRSDKVWKGHDGQNNYNKNACKNAWRSIFIPEKYVFRGCFESPFTRISDIQPEIQLYKWSLG